MPRWTYSEERCSECRNLFTPTNPAAKTCGPECSRRRKLKRVAAYDQGRARTAGAVPTPPLPASKRHVTTSEVEYTPDELEFLRGLQWLKQAGRPKPDWAAVLWLAHALGYRLVAEPAPEYAHLTSRQTG